MFAALATAARGLYAAWKEASVPQSCILRATSPLKKRPVRLLILAAWFALFSGLVEVFYWVVMRAVGASWYLGMSPDFVWMTPATDLIVFAGPGLLFFLLARRGPEFPWPRVALFVYCWMTFTKLLLLAGKLHDMVVMLFACGLAVHTSRLLDRHAARLWPWITRTLSWMVYLATGLAATRVGSTWRAEWQAHNRLPPAPRGAPNVLLITLDTVRAKNLSLYGYGRHTSPQLERWAKKGVTFERALATAPWTLPSHASMFTGRYPDDLSAGWQTPLDGRYPTLAEVLASHGYATAGFVANRAYCGLDSGLNRGFARYEDYRLSPGEFVNTSTLAKWVFGKKTVRRLLDYYDLYGRKSASAVNESFLKWQADRGERPFFAFLNYFDAHDPYLPEAPFDRRFGPALTAEQQALMIDWWPCSKLQLTKSQIELAMRAYDSCIAALDHHVGLLLDELDRRGVLDNTLVIITADHGEQFGEHDLLLHGNSLYRESLHVPLVVIFPGRVPAERRVKGFVSLRDLPATVLDLLRLEGKGWFPGRSLARCWPEASGPAQASENPVLCEVFPGAGDPSGHRCSPVARGSLAAVFLEGKYYIRNLKDNTEELYDFEGDPLERHNLAQSAEMAPVVDRYRRALNKAMAEE
jgi:arylsulfatase A-like enzyme